MFFQLGLIGYPLGHSLSPKIHAAALEACSLQGVYSLFPISPQDDGSLKALLARLRAGKLHGLNVTIPHKQSVIPLLDELTSTAQAIGAVNTLFMRGGQLIGDNTDAPGFLTDLKRFIENRELEIANPKSQIANPKSQIANHKSALVLGAGGSARTIVYALINDGWDVTLAARRLEQAQELAARYAPRVDAVRLTNDDLSSLPFPALIVNTTPLGMTPQLQASPWPADLFFPPDVAVYDLVYNPSETQLVKDARSAGLAAISGVGMLIEQAALSFERWTGCPPPREALRLSVAP